MFDDGDDDHDLYSPHIMVDVTWTKLWRCHCVIMSVYCVLFYYCCNLSIET